MGVHDSKKTIHMGTIRVGKREMVTVGEVTLAKTQCLPPAQKIDLNYYFEGEVKLKVPKKYYNYYLAEVKKSEINQKYKISEIALIAELLMLLTTSSPAF